MHCKNYPLKKYSITLLAFIINICSCSFDSNKPSYKSEEINNNNSGQALNAIDLKSESDCWNFLNGKSFYSDKARLEFNSSGNAYVYRLNDNQAVFAGSVSLLSYVNGVRKIKIHDTLGSNQVINLSLSNMGELIDLSDYTVYKSM